MNVWGKQVAAGARRGERRHATAEYGAEHASSAAALSAGLAAALWLRCHGRGAAWGFDGDVVVGQGGGLGECDVGIVTVVATKQSVGLRGVLLLALRFKGALALLLCSPVEDAGPLDLLWLAKTARKRGCASLNDCAVACDAW